MTRKELLERWCIDYVATNMDRPNSTNVSALVDDSIAQLRQVCKRVMVLLRTLYTFIRLMPAFHLQQGLGVLQKSNKGRNGTYGNEAGYYSNKSHAEPQKFDSNMRTLCGRILFTFHASEADTATSDAAFLSLNAPFSKRDLNSIPTPYGLLNLSVLYDSSLNIDRVMTEASDRISLRRTHAIPIHQQSAPIQGPGLINNRPEFNIQNLSISSADNDVAHHHIIHDYATSPSLRSRSFSPHIQRSKVMLNKSRSSITDQSSYQNDKTTSFHSICNTSGRVLSGISLALMSDENTAGSNDQLLHPRSHANTVDEFVLSKQRRAFHQPPPSMTTSSVLQTSNGTIEQSVHSHYPSLYAYGYNNGRLINTKTMPIQIASSDKAVADTSMPVNTPPAPAFLGSTPRLTGSLPIRAALDNESTAAAERYGTITNSSDIVSKVRSVSPPFRNPIELMDVKTRVLGESTLTAQNNDSSGPSNSHQVMGYVSEYNNAIIPPLSSLDVLTFNPFSISLDRSAMSSGLYYSTLTRESHSHIQSTHDYEMPFAIHASSSFKSFQHENFGSTPRHHSLSGTSLDSNKASTIDALPNLSASEVLTTLANRCVNANRLRSFEHDEDGLNKGDSVKQRATISDRSALQCELEKFRSFGLSLTTT